jgi:basic membrane protein A and related proteins
MRVSKLLLAVALAGLAGLSSAASEELKIAGVVSGGVESAWDRAFMDSVQRVVAAKPYGLDITFDFTENVSYDQAEQIYRAYADSGKYDIILGDGSWADAVEQVMVDYPDTMFVVAGSGNKPLGANGYWIYIHGHEPAYLLGMLAGGLTENKVVGVVGTYPADDANDQINAFFAGAKSMDPSIKGKVTFIQSWYDPPKSMSATVAQVAAGADFIYQLAPAYEGCLAKQIGCFGNFADMSPSAPEAIVSSTITGWDPLVMYLIDQWRAKKESGGEYDAPMEPVWFPMAKGGLDIAPYHAWEDKIPADLKEKVAAARAAILDGSLTVPLDTSEPKSD